MIEYIIENFFEIVGFPKRKNGNNFFTNEDL